MTCPHEDEPRFFVLDYITITRDPRTQLVVAVGGDDRAAGILQTIGGFTNAPGPRGPYHRQPHTMPVQEQRQGATAAAHALLLAGFSVHLDPTLNTLGTPDGDRQATHRYLDQLAERARHADGDREVAGILSEIAAPHEGLLPRLVQTLTATWATWAERLHDAERDRDPAQQLASTTSGLSDHAWQIEQIRNQAASTPPALPTTPRPATVPSTSPPVPTVRRH
ncbi:hypothetical protein [Streptomyces sp. 769]|uniref:hypothetical protein n=1 Tax=Streptomyces sp. 769 TaxID=1262452 RepID=UPI00057CF013|nr:hypothetical protein [Streptomyces sp. 769]AJC55073.1 hypothetical protein GZL_02482 [Streptomyces sp. 769]